jgi:hypothetical protein
MIDVNDAKCKLQMILRIETWSIHSSNLNIFFCMRD